MELKFYRVFFAFFIIATIGYTLFWKYVPTGSEAFQTSSVPNELINHNYHWRYENGWNFKVRIDKAGLHWQGIGGDFDGMSMSVAPHYRKLADNLYFATWIVPYAGFDSLVIDFESNKIYAHSKANSKFFSLQGEIYCNGQTQECDGPNLNQ